MGLGFGPVSSAPIAALGSELQAPTSAIATPVKTFYAKSIDFIFYSTQTPRRLGTMGTVDFSAPTVRTPFLIRVGDDVWGPFKADFSAHLPDGVTVSSGTITSLDSDGAEAAIIEPGTAAVVDDSGVQFRLQAPSGTGAGKYFLKFELTLSDGGIKSFRFGPITVEGW